MILEILCLEMCAGINIRNCSAKDLERILEIENECFEHPYPEYVFQEYLDSDLFLVAENEEYILGYIMSDVRESEGVIISIAVDTPFQRNGIGKRLIEKTIERLSIEYIVLTVRTNNEGAQKFYERLDFDRLYVIDEYYENDEDAIVMGKQLSDNE